MNYLATAGRSALGVVRWLHQRWRHVLVLTHRAYFHGSSDAQYFVKLTNVSPKREVEVTHIWLETKPPVHVLNPARPLPARLRMDETYETWIPVAEVPNPNAETLVRVRLSSGKVVKSRLNKKVPPHGYVAGGGSP